MRIRLLALGLLWVAGLSGQHRRFSWQDYCFNHPAAPFCQGHDYAVRRTKPGKDGTPQTVVSVPFPPIPPPLTPSVIVVGGIDWRFADPSADAIVGFNVSGLRASPLAQSLMVRLGA